MNILEVNYLYQDQCLNTEIHSENGQKTLEHTKAVDIINKWCLNNGSTMEGRISAMKYIIGCSHKVPCLISLRNSLIFFPVFGRAHDENYWICWNRIVRLKAYGKTTCILFRDGTSVLVNLNYRSLNEQRDRCAVYLNKLHERETLMFGSEEEETESETENDSDSETDSKTSR